MLDMTKMTDEELRATYAKISAEMMMRERLEEERLWNNFVDALHAYCKKFGDIEITDNCTADDCVVYLNPDEYDLQTFGEITPKY